MPNDKRIFNDGLKTLFNQMASCIYSGMPEEMFQSLEMVVQELSNTSASLTGKVSIYEDYELILELLSSFHGVTGEDKKSQDERRKLLKKCRKIRPQINEKIRRLNNGVAEEFYEISARVLLEITPKMIKR